MDISELIFFTGAFLVTVWLIIDRHAPFLKAKLLNASKKGSNYGAVIIRGPGGSIQTTVADHNKPLDGWIEDKRQAYNLQANIIGNKGGSVVSLHNMENVNDKPTWSNSGSVTSAKELDTVLMSAYEAGAIETKSDLDLIKKIQIVSALLIVGALVLGYMAFNNTTTILNNQVIMSGQFSNLTSIVTSHLSTGVIIGQ